MPSSALTWLSRALGLARKCGARRDADGVLMAGTFSRSVLRKRPACKRPPSTSARKARCCAARRREQATELRPALDRLQALAHDDGDADNDDHTLGLRDALSIVRHRLNGYLA